ncbi:protein quick-to-court-like [Physella acuta]|uniref:protein quick-to-court-like n=1 Tax=Physella acuta TaxID=109671 RepID=UPI0027DC26B7|nr:protein quick-to-court-like [Physella acuta]XP_059170333.1 protein quick-to-court-like [Physella acuta]
MDRIRRQSSLPPQPLSQILRSDEPRKPAVRTERKLSPIKKQTTLSETGNRGLVKVRKTAGNHEDVYGNMEKEQGAEKATAQMFHIKFSENNLSRQKTTDRSLPSPTGDNSASSHASSDVSCKRFHLRHSTRQESTDQDLGNAHYVTPLKRSQLEVKELRSEVAQLLQEIEEKKAEVVSLTSSLENEKVKSVAERDKEIEELKRILNLIERQRDDCTKEINALKEELRKMDKRYSDLKLEFTKNEEKFEIYLLDMYNKGLEAARFEREEELEMLVKDDKSSVTVRELTRKLSRTEAQLAMWQGLKLGESYTSTELPHTEAEATLSFLRDSFYHFLTDRSGSEEHLRAMIKILHYSDVQLLKIWRGLEEFKHLDRKKVLDKTEIVEGERKNNKKFRKQITK